MSAADRARWLGQTQSDKVRRLEMDVAEIDLRRMSPPTNTQEPTTSFPVEDLQSTVTVPPIPPLGKRMRNGEIYTPAQGTGRVTTRDVRQLIDTLKDIITHQTALIESSMVELLVIKHDQNALQAQNKTPHEEVRALRTQIDALPSTSSARSCAAVAANIGD